MVGQVLLTLPPNSQLITALPDWRYDLKIRTAWLARIINIPLALEARGYLAATTASITLEITDDVIAENNGLWTLAIERGVPAVTRPTAPTNSILTLDIRDLAPLYTGYATPHALRDAGRAQCDDRTVELAAAIFSTPGLPAMTDMF